MLDNEAVQALRGVRHPKHRVVAAHLEAVVQRRRRGADVAAVVPTAVRVEAGWDRSAAGAAAVNRFRVGDRALDTPAADVAATIRADLAVSVADAHVGAAVRALAADDVVVLTSDPADMARVSQPRTVTAVRI